MRELFQEYLDTILEIITITIFISTFLLIRNTLIC